MPQPNKQPKTRLEKAQELASGRETLNNDHQGGINTKKSETYASVFKNYPDVVTVEQMSEMLGISTKTAYKLLKENKIKHFMIGRIYKIPKYYILTYLEILDQKNSNP